jgi:hypothetical protein
MKQEIYKSFNEELDTRQDKQGYITEDSGWHTFSQFSLNMQVIDPLAFTPIFTRE